MLFAGYPRWRENKFRVSLAGRGIWPCRVCATIRRRRCAFVFIPATSRMKGFRPMTAPHSTASSTCDFCDAHKADDSGAFRVLPPVFQSYGGVAAFAGAVATVKCFEDNTLVKAAVDSPGLGRVLVVDGGGSLRRALVGGSLAAAAARNGWAGVVVDGCVRDVAYRKTQRRAARCGSADPGCVGAARRLALCGRRRYRDQCRVTAGLNWPFDPRAVPHAWARWPAARWPAQCQMPAIAGLRTTRPTPAPPPGRH